MFEARDGGTLARDVAPYSVPLGFVAHPLFVRPVIENIFGFQQEVWWRRFGGAKKASVV